MNKEHLFNNIELERYRSYCNLKEFTLNPVNILIGENGSGKSNFLEVFAILKRGAQRELQSAINHLGGVNEIITYEGGPDLRIKLGLPIRKPAQDKVHPFIELILDNIQSGYSIGKEVVGYQKISYTSPYEWLWRSNSEIHYRGFEPIPPEETPLFDDIADDEKKVTMKLASIRKTLEDMDIISGEMALPYFRQAIHLNEDLSFIQDKLANIGDYRFLEFRERSPIRWTQMIQRATRLNLDGSNLVNVLYTMRTDRKYQLSWDKLEKYMKVAFDDYESLDFPSAGGDGKIQIAWNSPYYSTKSFSANTLSTGTLQYLCLLTIFLCPDPPPLILIEEPENHLNLRMFAPLAEAIYEASKKTQIIMTTHSPLFLNNFELEDIIITEKKEGCTQITRMSDKDTLREFIDDFTAGEMMEKGLIYG